MTPVRSLFHATRSKAKFLSLFHLHSSSLQNYFAHPSLMISSLKCPVPLNQICPISHLVSSSTSPVLSAKFHRWYWVLGTGQCGSSGIYVKGWHDTINRASLRQPESRCWIYLQPTCQLMLFVGVRQVGIASLAFTLPRCPKEIKKKMGGGKIPLVGVIIVRKSNRNSKHSTQVAC